MMKELIVPERTNLIINDSRLPTELICRAFKTLASTSKVELQILDGDAMTKEITDQLLTTAGDSGTTAILLPETGALIVCDFFERVNQRLTNEFRCFSIPTKRELDRNVVRNLSVTIPADLTENVRNGNTKTVIILDDVVATGLTVETIKDNLEAQTETIDDTDYDQSKRFSFPQITAPGIDWVVISWLRQKQAKTDGFKSAAAIEYSRKSGRVPLNSLTTFLSETEKGKTVLDNYANKYFADKLLFYKVIESLKGENQ